MDRNIVVKPSPPTQPPHWPLDKIAARLQTLKKQSNNSSNNRNKTVYVLLTTGALNPVHRGHTEQLHHVARALEELHGLTVIGAFISPSSDVYLRGKFPQGCGDFFFPGVVRHAACVKATRNDDLISVGGFEISCTDRWPDFPEVCAELQQLLDAQRQTLWNPSSPASDDAAANASAQEAPRIECIYCCGSDHYLKCALWRGVRLNSKLGSAKVACTIRSGDEQRLQDSQYKSEMAFILPSLPAAVLADVSSTKIRQALQLLGGAMDPAAVDELLKLMFK